MAKKVIIPFLPEFEQPMLSGKKTCTTRTERLGHAGDWFPAFGKRWVLTEVYQVPLMRVVVFYYEQEGFNTSKEFIDCWNRLHPHVTYEYQRARPIYIHHFKPMELP